VNAAPALLGCAAVAGLVVPGVLAHSRWPHRSPLLATALWGALAASFSLSVVLAAIHAATPGAHEPGLLYSCRVALGMDPSHEGVVQRWGLAVLGAVAALHVGGFAFHALRARATRVRHREAVDMVGRHAPDLQATVVDHARPAAYCLPGRRSRIVVSQGALECLTGPELGAVLEHERAHVTGRHHLVLAAVQAFGTLFAVLPLARHLREQVPLLLEMAADDRALRRYPHGVLASAIVEMAAAQAAPRGALSAAGAAALPRVRRMLSPGTRSRPALRAALAVSTGVMPLLPVVFACPPTL
jgi:Zn-dependent protease with chaperone function